MSGKRQAQEPEHDRRATKRKELKKTDTKKDKPYHNVEGGHKIILMEHDTIGNEVNNKGHNENRCNSMFWAGLGRLRRTTRDLKHVWWLRHAANTICGALFLIVNSISDSMDTFGVLACIVRCSTGALRRRVGRKSNHTQEEQQQLKPHLI